MSREKRPKRVGPLPPGAIPAKNGGYLIPAQKGEVRNPTGETGEFGKCVRLARTVSLETTEKLIEQMRESLDDRVVFMASKELYERAWGRDRTPPADDDGVAKMQLALINEALRMMARRLREAEAPTERS